MSGRTIERDISALQQSGVPVWAEPGRPGGYCLDKERTLPPVNFTPGEAMALAVALRHVTGTPFSQDGAAALRKVTATMRAADTKATHDLVAWAHLLDDASPPTVPAVITDALATKRVLRIGYADRRGLVTSRDVEPIGFLGARDCWYLLAWCGLRGSVRVFRTDRITSVAVTAQVPVPRHLHREDLDIPRYMLRSRALSDPAKPVSTSCS